MLSKKIVAGAAGLFLVAGGSIGALTANAAPTAPTTACGVDGSVLVTNNAGGDAPAFSGAGSQDTFNFSGVTITCGSSVSGFTGSWTGISATGSGTVLNSALSPTLTGETCSQGSGQGDFTAGTGPNGQSVSGGHFTFDRVGSQVVVTGSIIVDGASHPFNSSLTFAPAPGSPCLGGSGPTTATLIGTAQIDGSAS